MRITSLNCGTLCPLGAPIVGGDGSLFSRARLICHCLVIETARGLVLVETGLSAADVDRSHGPLHTLHLKALLWASLTPGEPAIRQLRALGYDPRDVRDIVVTHLDLDHAGGLGDFPHARVHVAEAELRQAHARPTLRDRIRYAPVNWAHGPRWVTYPTEGGASWYGLEGARPLEGLPPEILWVPLHGHTRGHAAIAVRSGSGWILHAGDAYVHRDELVPARPRRRWLEAFQTFVSATHDRTRRRSREALRRLHRDHAHTVRVINAHDPVHFEELRVDSLPRIDAGDAVDHRRTA